MLTPLSKEINQGNTKSSVQRPQFNLALEGLRAFAALVVIIGHIVYYKRVVDPAFQPSGWASFQAPGHHAVLVFFVLSGYVIGLNHPRPLQRSEVSVYLRKRFTRLYPIYLIALFGGLLASGFAYSWSTFGWHLVFGVNGLPVLTMYENNPIWSLQYEVLFYLLFVPLSMINARPFVVAGVSILLAFSCLTADPVGAGRYASQYLFGFSIWSVGWALAKLDTTTGTVRYSQLVSALLLFLTLEVFNVLDTVGRRLLEFAALHPVGLLNVAQWKSQFLTPIDLMALPYAVLIVGQFLNFKAKVWRMLLIVLQLLPLYTFKYLLAQGQSLDAAKWTIPTICYIISTVLFIWPSSGLIESVCQRFINILIPVGAISYGLYIIHFPIIVAFHKIEFFSGTWLTYSIRVMLVIGTTYAAAYWLEKKYQPVAKRLLSPRR
jgi:peptidoglycan/LPS O-acetylase OafA/YrhL